MTIQERCKIISEGINNPFFFNYHLLKLPEDKRYKKAFTSIDIIEDSQKAIDEFKEIPEGSFIAPTLMTYGILQSIYLQQDGLFLLYQIIPKYEGARDEMFKKFNYENKIRAIRNDIGGHPSGRNDGSFHYLIRGRISKNSFSYASYSPDFKTQEVNLKESLRAQSEFAHKILQEIENHISNTIKLHKKKFQDKKIIDLTDNIGRSILLINRGIKDVSRKSQAEIGIDGITNTIKLVKIELNKRYNKIIPDTFEYHFKFVKNILEKLEQWYQDDELLNNPDAPVFLDSLKNQMEILSKMIGEVDKEFEK